MMEEGRVLTVSEAAALYPEAPYGEKRDAELGHPTSGTTGANQVLWDGFKATFAVIGLTVLLIYL